MAFDLSTPVAKLAFEMALRNQQAQDSSAPFDASARAFVSKALATGNDQLAPYDDIYRQYVDPAEANRRAQAKAFNDYLVGLPELLSASQKELAALSGGSGGKANLDTTNLSNYMSPQERLNMLLGNLAPVSKPKLYATSPEDRLATTRTGMGSRVTARRL